jgi:predicted Zn-dependent peptidase
MDFLYSAAYQQTPFQQTVGGEIAELKKATSDDIHAFRTQNYTGANIVVSASGNFDQAKVETSVGAAFASVPQTQSRLSNERVPFTGSFMHVRDETVHEVQFAIAYETFSYNHKHALTLGLLQQLVGEWSNASLAGTNGSPRLAEGFALQTGLVDRYHTFSHLYRNTGLFGVYASTHNIDKVDDAVYHIFNEYQKLFTYISPEELFRVQNALKAKILASEESSASRSRHIGEQVLNLDRRLSLAEAFARIDNITIKDIKEVIDQYFYDVDPVVVAHGDLEEMPDYVVMRNWTYWNRW